MTRLTVDLKKTIARNAQEKSNAAKKLKELESVEHDLARRALVDYAGGESELTKFTLKAKRAYKALSELPSEFHHDREPPKKSSIDIRCEGLGHNVTLNFKIPKLFANRGYYRVKDKRLAADIVKWWNAHSAAYEERSNVYHEVMGALSSITTVKKLLEVWPEAAELLPADVGTAKSSLPMVQTDDLNRIIGLPSEGADNAIN